MNINFTGRNTEIGPKIKKYCERRVEILEKHLGGLFETDIILSVEKYRKKAEIIVKIKGGQLAAIEETEDMMSSLVQAFDHIEKRIKKEKEKLREKKRRVKREMIESASPETEIDQEIRVIRNNQYSFKPMAVEEAAMLFDQSKDEVFIFRIFESEKWAVLYRRKDGHIGLIDPEA